MDTRTYIRKLFEEANKDQNYIIASKIVIVSFENHINKPIRTSLKFDPDKFTREEVHSAITNRLIDKEIFDPSLRESIKIVDTFRNHMLLLKLCNVNIVGADTEYAIKIIPAYNNSATDIILKVYLKGVQKYSIDNYIGDENNV